MRRIGILLLSAFLAGCMQKPPMMVYKQINLGRERIKLTKLTLCKQYQLCHGSIVIQPSMIVLTWTRATSWRDVYQRYRHPTRDGKLNRSVQYLVAADGTVYQLMMPNNWMANFDPRINDQAIIIENIDAPNNINPENSLAQQHADLFLIKLLKKQYGSIDSLATYDSPQQLAAFKQLMDEVGDADLHIKRLSSRI